MFDQASSRSRLLNGDYHSWEVSLMSVVLRGALAKESSGEKLTESQAVCLEAYYKAKAKLKEKAAEVKFVGSHHDEDTYEEQQPNNIGREAAKALRLPGRYGTVGGKLL